MKFDIADDCVVFRDDKPGSYASMGGPRGAMLFRGDKSRFNDAKREYAWAFEWSGDVKDGDQFIFSTADRRVVGEVQGGIVVTLTEAELLSRPPAGLVSSSNKAKVTGRRVMAIFPGVQSPGAGWNTLSHASANNESAYMAHGMSYISAYLKSRGHDVWLLDTRGFQNWEHFIAEVRRQEYDFAMLGPLSIEAFTAACIIRVLKEAHPRRPVILGGLHVSMTKDKVFPPDDLPKFYFYQEPPSRMREFLNLKGEGVFSPQWPKADYVVWNEGELATAAIVEGSDLRSADWDYEQMPGGTAFMNGKIVPDLNAMPHMDRSLFNEDMEKNHPLLPELPAPFHTVTFGRGCPYKCAYCSVGVQFSSTKVRLIDPDYFMDALRELHRANGGRIGSLMIHDDILLFPSWLEEWNEKIKSNFGYIPYWCQMRSDFICNHPNVVRHMAEAGMTWVSVGYECIDGDSQILMDSGEVRSIKEATGNAVAVASSGAVVKADSVLIDQGKVLDMVRVETSTREIVASLEHRFFRFDDGALIEVKARDLKIDDWVAVCRRAPGLGSVTMSEKRAELAGFFLGDGTLTQDKGTKRRFRLAQKDSRLLQHYADTVTDEFGVSANVNRSPSRDIATFETGNIGVTEWASTLRRPSRGGFDEIPDIIMKGDDAIIASFLRGYYDAEGSVSVAEKKITIVCKHERPMRQVKNLLMRLGIISGKVLRQDYTTKLGSFTQYSIWVRQADAVRRFSEMIGFNHSARSKRLSAVVKSLGETTRKGEYLPFSKAFCRQLNARYSPGKGKKTGSFRPLRGPLRRVMYSNKTDHGVRRCDLETVLQSLDAAGFPTCPEVDIIKRWLKVEDIGFERVKTITAVGKRRAYDLHVSQHHTYVADGFMVHNSGHANMLSGVMNKGLKVIGVSDPVEINLRAAEILKQLGVNSFGNFMFGNPTETNEEMNATVEMIQKIQPQHHGFSTYAGYPGTPMEALVDREGLRMEEWYARSHYPWQYRLKGVDYAHVNSCINRAALTPRQYLNPIKAGTRK